MVTQKDREIITSAEKLYEERLKRELEENHMHEYVVIEPESGEYFLGRTVSEATQKARAVYPHRRSHIMRVGHRAAFHIGGVS